MYHVGSYVCWYNFWELLPVVRSCTLASPLVLYTVVPSFTKAICIDFFFWFLASFRCFSITYVNFLSTWMYRQIYDKAMVHAESMWCKVPLFPHRGQSDVYIMFHLVNVVSCSTMRTHHIIIHIQFIMWKYVIYDYFLNDVN